MPTTCKLIAKTTLGSDAASVTFGSGGTIPQSFTDLLIVFSARSSRSQPEDGLGVKINSETSGYTYRVLSGNGATVSSINTAYEATWATRVVGATATSSTFGNGSVYFPNYAGSTSKSYSAESVTENNSSTAFITLSAINQSSTSAITELTLSALNGNLVSGSSFFLYGITRADDNLPGTFGIQATGGDVTISGGYKYHVFKSSGTFTVNEPGFAEVLVVAGGGGGSKWSAGGGAGGLLSSNRFIRAGSYSVGVGGGGSGGTTGGYAVGVSGTQSSFSEITTFGGGGAGWFGYGGAANTYGQPGGSGGGGGSTVGGSTFYTGGAGVAGQGSSGGTGDIVVPYRGGGGGGAGSAGNSGATNGNGGSGLTVFGTAYAGGGGAGSQGGTAGIGGTGGGGNGSNSGSVAGSAGMANTGGGGGGGGSTAAVADSVGGNGGSGIVIIRYPVS